MAWSAKTNAAQLVTITVEQFFNTIIQLNPGEVAHVEVEANPPVTPTDRLVVACYGTLDDAAENWDDTPFLEFEIPNAPDPCKASFVLSGRYRTRIGVRRSGSTDTVASADMSYRKDGVSV